MPKLSKILSRLDNLERIIVSKLISDIFSLKWNKLDVKKLKGYTDVFRVRKGKLRIVFQKSEKDIVIFSIDKRNDNTYNL